jgi:hypothetical protein
MVLGLTQPASATATAAAVTRATSFTYGTSSSFYAVTTDTAGNQYVGGDADGRVALVKYSASGSKVWQKLFASQSGGDVVGIAALPDGNLVAVGYFCGDLVLGSLGTRNSRGDCDGFAMKLDASGAPTVFKSLGIIQQNSFSIGRSVDLDQSGNIYVDFNTFNLAAAGAAGIDGVTWSSTVNQAGEAAGDVIVKFDSSLIAQRATPLPSGFNSDSLGAAFDVAPSGKILIGGSFSETTDFGNFGTLTPSPTNINDAVWMQINAQGDVDIFNSYNSSWQDYIHGVGYDASGNIYVFGDLGASASISGTTVTPRGGTGSFVAKYNSTGSALRWVQDWGPSGIWGLTGYNFGVDSAGNVVATGMLSAPSMTVGSLPSITTTSANEAYLVGLNSDGSFAFLKGTSTPLGAAVNLTKLYVADGAVYQVGNFVDATDFGDGQSLTTVAGNYDAFLVKTSITWANTKPLPKAVWRQTMDSTQVSNIYDMATDQAGNTYEIGEFEGTYAGHVAVNALSGKQAIVTKRNSAGTELWSYVFSIPGGVSRRLAVDSTGNVYVAGAFWQPISVGGTIHNHGAGWADTFLFKLSTAGSLTWYKQFNTRDYDTTLIQLDAAGNIYFPMYFDNVNLSGQTGVDSVTWSSSQFTTNNPYGNVLFKISPAGTVLRATPLPANIYMPFFDEIAVSESGRVSIAGLIWGTVQFDNFGPFDVQSGNSAFWMEFDSSGAVTSFNVAQNSNYSYATGVSYDAAENLYVTGTYNGNLTLGSSQYSATGGNSDIFLAKFASDRSLPVWSHSIGGDNDDSATGIALDPAGNIVITSYLAGTFTIPNFPSTGHDEITTSSNGGVLVMGFSNDGSTSWYMVVENEANENGLQQSSQPVLFENNVYFGGRDFNSSEGFVQKVSYSFANSTPIVSNQNQNQNQNQVVAAIGLPAIQVGSISPRVIDSAAGGVVVITSSNANKVSSVKLGAVSVPFKILSADKFQVTLPGHAVGYADLTFTTREGTVPLSNAVQFSDVLNTHLAVITLVNPTKTALARAQAKFVKITYTDRVVTKGKKPKITITLTGRIKN